MSEKRMREQFEKWAEGVDLSPDFAAEREKCPDDPTHGWNYGKLTAWEAWQARDAEVQALERVALNVMASLDAALSILGRSHEGKVPANEAVASDRMFTMMLDDYQKSLDAARAALAGGETGETE